MQKPTKDDPEARVEADDILYWAERLNVSPEELRSAVQKGGSMVHDVIAELRRRGFEPDLKGGHSR
jgi:DNA-binding winged helix-turn-helix (wHTH) protein